MQGVVPRSSTSVVGIGPRRGTVQTARMRARRLSIAMTLAAASAPSGAQTLWTPAGPFAQAGQAMAYDSARGRIVMFGGYEGSYLGTTWEWDGTSWLARAPATSPPVRANHAMAYDSARQRVVLFGGIWGTAAFLGDTWEWDGSS